jgi:acetoin utilization deacetylase AcuC-like enzyme
VNTAIFYSPKFLEHHTGPGHPESPSRLKAIIQELNQSGLLRTGKCAVIEPNPVSLEDLMLVHKPDYVKLVEQTCASGGGILDLGDTVVRSKSCEAAVLAVGALVDAVNAVANGKVRNAFALVRPPGHHAGASYAWGFCLFNNIAVAAAYLLSRLRLKRVLIIDIDAHHGNGTQEIFYATNRVLYISIHEDPRAFPGTGFGGEVGEGKGVGYTVNLPLPFRSTDEIYRKAFEEIVAPISTQYKPQFILTSAGFDGHYTDPVGALSLSMEGYEENFAKILALASQLCERKLVVALEGGYSLKFLGKMATAAIAKMAEVSYRVDDNSPSANPKTRKKADAVISHVKRIQSSFWKL